MVTSSRLIAQMILIPERVDAQRVSISDGDNGSGTTGRGRCRCVEDSGGLIYVEPSDTMAIQCESTQTD